jgi:xanthine dehydrogenase iron-sulfur cluster and FAD-binding subunit A
MKLEDDVEVRLQVNGQTHRAAVPSPTTLLDWLRESAGLTGAKKGCNEGACGTCTVLVDGQPVIQVSRDRTSEGAGHPRSSVVTEELFLS